MTRTKQFLQKNFLFFLVLLIYVFISIQAFGEQVSDISISGNQRVSEGTIRSYLSLDIGDDISSDVLDGAIDRLFDTNLFNDVNISSENGLVKIIVQKIQ